MPQGQPLKTKAQYSGHCHKCNKPINVGDYITWPRVKVEPGARRKFFHHNCEHPTVWKGDEAQEQPPHEPTPSPDDMDKLCRICNERKGKHKADSLHCPNLNAPGFNPTYRYTEKSEEHDTPELPDFDAQGDIPMHDMAIPGDTPAQKPNGSTGDGLLDLISSKVQENVIANVQAKVDRAVAHIDKIVQDKLDKLSIPSIVLKRHDLPDIKIHNVHKQFNAVLQLLNAGEYVYLHGSPGGHKSSIGPQLAEALGVRYGYMSLCEQTPEYVVKGFTSPINGEYYQSQFVDFYENGGLFCWEEMDAANDNLRASLNTMLENKLAALDKGLVKMHDNFYMLANGNTCGRGAHPAFPSRTGFDAAFAARFVFLQFEYDWQLCKHIVLGLNDQAGPLVKWGESVSNWALANGVQLVMSPREAYKLAKLSKLTDLPDDLLLDGVLRGLDVPSKEKLLSNYPYPHINRSSGR